MKKFRPTKVWARKALEVHMPKCIECGEEVIAPLKICGGCNADAIRQYCTKNMEREETDPIDPQTGEIDEVFGRKD